MTRDEVIGILSRLAAEEAALRFCSDPRDSEEHAATAEALREAICLLSPVPSEEIEKVRAIMQTAHFTGWTTTHVVVLLRALDALAQQPELEARCSNLDRKLHTTERYNDELEARIVELEAEVADWKKSCIEHCTQSRIAALEAREKRVRELLERWDHEAPGYDVCHGCREDLREALDGPPSETPKVKP